LLTKVFNSVYKLHKYYRNSTNIRNFVKQTLHLTKVSSNVKLALLYNVKDALLFAHDD